MMNAAQAVGCEMMSMIKRADVGQKIYSQSPAKAACCGISASKQYVEKLVTKASFTFNLGSDFIHEPRFLPFK